MQECVSLHSCLKDPLSSNCVEKGVANGFVFAPLHNLPFALSPLVLVLRQRGKPNLELVPFQNRPWEPAPGALETHEVTRPCYPQDPGGGVSSGLSVFLRLERSPSVSLGLLSNPWSCVFCSSDSEAPRLATKVSTAAGSGSTSMLESRSAGLSSLFTAFM